MLRLVVIAGLVVVFSPSHSCELNPSYFMPQKILQSLCNTFCNTRSRTLFPQFQEMNNKAFIFCGMCPPKNNTTTTKAPSQPTVTKPATTSTPSVPTVTKSEASTPSTTATPPISTTSGGEATPATSTTTENAEKQAGTETTTST